MRKFIVPAAILIVSLAFALTLAAFVWRSSAEADRLRFESFADDAIGRVRNQLDLHVSLIEATRAYLRVDEEGRDRTRFASYVANLDLDGIYDGVQGIGFAAAVPRDESAALDQSLRASVRGSQGIWPPESDQTVRAPIVLLEPQDRRNQAAIGFDMFSDPIRRRSLVEAARWNVPAATGPVRLVQEIDENRQAGFLIYLALNENTRPASDDEAVLGSGGYVFAPFRAGDLIDAALSSGQTLPLDVKVYDTRIAPENLLVDTALAQETEVAGEFSAIRELDVGGRGWLVELTPSPSFSRTSSDLPAFLLCIVGVALSVLLALLAFSQARRAEAVSALAEASTRSLAQKDLLLREMNHRIKNSITRVLAIARQTGRHSADLDAFMTSYTARLAAMATSQEMLTQSERRRVTVRELLTAELGQVFGEEMNRCTLEGPDIELDETAAQALGLTFHELATNALKYGSVAEDDGTLDVVWRQKSDEIGFDWTERGLKQFDGTPPERKGFGTRLIDMNIERELGGRIERDFRKEGLSIRLTIPAIRARESPHTARRKGKASA